MSQTIKNSGLRPREQGFRDYSYKRFRKAFGAGQFVPRNDSYDSTPSWIPILDQGPDDCCTAESLAIGKSVVEDKLISPEWQFKETKKKEGNYLSYGADPLDAIKAMQGGALGADLSPFKVGQNDRNQIANWKNWPSNLDEVAKIITSGAWFRPNGQKDLFDSIRQVLQDYGTKAIAIIDLYWQSHWTGAPGGIIEYDGIYSEINAHQVYVRVAQKIIGGELYLVIQNSYGDQVGDKGLFYFDRKTVNLFNKYKGGAKVLLDADPAEAKKVAQSLLQRIVDALMKLLQQINNPPIPTPQVIVPDESAPEPVKPIEKPMSKIEAWALAIKEEEGWAPGTRSFRNKNLGNMKYSALTASLGAVGHDDGNFSIFPTYEAGLSALCEFLKLGCRDQLKAFHNARTLKEFTQVFAHPPAAHPYAENVAKKLGVKVDIDIKELL